ncbi:MAG TPA: DUF3427 domain-containing protein [Geminicoccus sp.]|uniref:DUF3427 domain-containing protein n=1 Tax=Geminicoccus sp. TaxID=2024832 RepID=UPI002CC8D7EA|nr:DUF3427 domain-containing protein [Geminicoccus sp.]HWL69447.1 DUF3427 domain-containing protein [Geminicoccus sp.]
MAEHDRLGPAAFLRKYGYGAPTGYWILHEGKRYPSKAILGVAWHYEDPARPALRPTQFSGGEATVQRKAEQLGFKIVVDSAPQPAGQLLSGQLTPDEVYTRADLAERLGISPGAMGSGVFRRKGSSSVLLFVTEHKSADRTPYEDRLEGDVLHWQGQEKRGTDSLIIEHAERGLELLVFYRRQKSEFPGYGFRYLGPFTYVSHQTPSGPGASSFVLQREGTLAQPDLSISAQEADEQAFDPQNLEDARTTVLRAIKARRGQAEFRRSLMAAYGERCAVTGCAVADVLEAAHILSYRGEETNHPSNGLLLRTDLHTLFDCDLVSVDPNGTEGPRLVVASSLRGTEYGALDGRLLRARKSGAAPLSTEALALRYAEFVRQHGNTARR